MTGQKEEKKETEKEEKKGGGGEEGKLLRTGQDGTTSKALLEFLADLKKQVISKAITSIAIMCSRLDICVRKCCSSTSSEMGAGWLGV